MSDQIPRRTLPQRIRRRTSRARSTSLYATPRATPAASPTPSTQAHSQNCANILNESPYSTSKYSGINKNPTIETPDGSRDAGYQLPAYWALAPVVPSPFTGTLEASLDAILEFGRIWGAGEGGMESGVRGVISTLLEDVDYSTDWPSVIQVLFDESYLNCAPSSMSMSMLMSSFAVDRAAASASEEGFRYARLITEELLFLTTRTLLPEQIVENRLLLARAYDVKRHLAIRLVLRYDMLREGKMDHHGKDNRSHPAIVNSVAAAVPPAVHVFQPKTPMFEGIVHRRPLLPNVWITIIAPPPYLPDGFPTYGYRERMRHHVTELDQLLLYTDEEVSTWSDAMLITRTSVVLLMWQWVRANNALMEDMECGGWEELDGRAEECNWVAS